ncbi:hypothetical protein [Brevibacterium daeguense]|nr:hypothetical protein [Brevibacterium daeguense]
MADIVPMLEAPSPGHRRSAGFPQGVPHHAGDERPTIPTASVFPVSGT